MNKLQNALRINAFFSSTSGIILIILNQQIAKLFGTSNTTVFWIVGIVLIYFALTIWFEIKKQRKSAIIWIITQDYIWVLVSILLVTFNPFQITKTGNLIISIIALIVLYMGVNQMIKLDSINK
ncbi:hypothetical protein J8L88_14890 [Aquimarina sp. MMG015]|uniref:hypothetical protein n=1 Tax=unclassified Aquimarina TaxID=2627091 RepID=UPI000E474808|nr:MULTISPECIES: hypothetical protein [unclassified Aquimarina]AXT54316.1 hypothetical protein D1815_00625 [Aquimarina sp. AD1]MBQ4804147.1 hypothetical protein [Aquimarina sp. MMG015]